VLLEPTSYKMSSKYGYSGSNYDQSVQNNNTSTFHKMKETYWTTKQAVIKKLGKKEDEHVVASDSMLDSKLEVFKAIQKSSMDLLRVIEKYQDRLCVVSQEENTMGRMLKVHSNKDKTRAGKMMAAVGKAESNSAQERLALHNPLRRLYSEVETFRYRAVSDTLLTINRMEGARTEYRGALLWMKNVSEELDPDMYKQLEKFRKVQAQVKRKKQKFDKLKLDVMQKVDLLAASRCNMFSHVLANYQTMLLHYWEKTSRTMSAVAESFKGYQYYEFNMLRELTEDTKKLAEETGSKAEETGNEESLINVGEQATQGDKESNNFDQSLLSDLNLGNKSDSEFGPFTDFSSDDTLLKDDDDDFDFSGKIMEAAAKNKEVQQQQQPGGKPHDLLSGEMPVEGNSPEEEDKDDMTLLNEILNAPSQGEDEFATQWNSVFGGAPTPLSPEAPGMPGEVPQQNSGFLPSSLLDTQLMGDNMMMGMGDPMRGLNQGPTAPAAGSDMSMFMSQAMPSAQMTPGQPMYQASSSDQQSAGNKTNTQPQQKGGAAANSKMSAYFNLFADLDPLSNPDAIGRKLDDMNDIMG